MNFQHFDFRMDKDKAMIMAEITDVRAATEEVARSKVYNIIKTH